MCGASGASPFASGVAELEELGLDMACHKQGGATPKKTSWYL
jgi:hypothetical protein